MNNKFFTYLSKKTNNENELLKIILLRWIFGQNLNWIKFASLPEKKLHYFPHTYKLLEII